MQVIAGMKKLGGYAQELFDIMTSRSVSPHELAKATAGLMSANFATRIELYGAQLALNQRISVPMLRFVGVRRGCGRRNQQNDGRNRHTVRRVC
jgi:hypothetical protein